VKFDISPPTQTSPKCLSSSSRAELTSSPTDSTGAATATPVAGSEPDFASGESKEVLALLAKRGMGCLVRQCGRSTLFVHDKNGLSGGHENVMERHPSLLSAAARPPAHAPKILINKEKKSVRNWAWQRIYRPGHYLASECTRYAHYYPQDLWTTRRFEGRGRPGEPYLARDSGQSRAGRGGTVGDAASPAG
jgi:hypothetical protein